MKLARKLLIVVGILGAAFCHAQIPDLLNSLDAGGRAMGMGGSLYGTGADTHSVLANPAGLGYVTQRQVSLAFRNKPTSSTNASNNFRNPDLATTANSGDIAISHAGYVQPVGKGAIGLSYTTGGFIRDEKSGVGDLVLDAGTSIRNYRELLKANIDFFTASYGASAGSSPLTWGVGLVVASTFVRNTQSYDLVSGGQANPTTPLDITGTGTGIGAVAGIQYVPPSKSNLVLGLSVRSPINLTGNSTTSQILDKIPGKIEASAAMRKEGLRGGNDYLIYGASIARYFRGDSSQLASREGAFSGGLGVEYNHLRGNVRIPLRLGYQVIQKGGRGFDSRNALTFGVGYRPLNQNYSMDLSFGFGSGTMDRSLSINYKLN